MGYMYMGVFRTKRHDFIAVEFDTEEEFDKMAEESMNQLSWAVLLKRKDGEFVKKVQGKYV